MKNFWKEFKDFALKGNMIDMAVGIMIGSAFSGLVSALVNDIMSPLISLIVGKNDMTGLNITLNNGTVIGLGDFLQALIDFFIMALCIFLVIKSINSFKTKIEAAEKKLLKKKQEEEKQEVKEPELSTEAKLLVEIKDLLEKKK